MVVSHSLTRAHTHRTPTSTFNSHLNRSCSHQWPLGMAHGHLKGITHPNELDETFCNSAIDANNNN